ncbi:MAG TPA: sugar ABC transporter permease [Spirochaetales bacterium]|nr:sugar ABC transporter permease [Spirochaetales bacterium]HRY54235.1 sugar ABC transporter permease [Spirochaetia bacterium]HRZ64872.1 sugar ABC transporter permease [Spirochaetia bacterium]
MGSFREFLRNNVRQYAMLIALLCIMLFFQVATEGVLLVPMNVTNLVLQNAYVFILAIGMTLTILTGGNIDLSVGSIVAFVGALAGTFVITMKMSVGAGIALSLLAGLGIGVWQAFWIAYVRLPSFIVTLAGQLVFRGLTVFMLKGLTIGPFPESFQMISSGFVPDLIGGEESELNLLALAAGAAVAALYILAQLRQRVYRRRNGYESTPVPIFAGGLVLVTGVIALASYWLASYRGLPIIFIIIGALIVAYSFFTSRTVPGRYLYAMGGNEKAAQLSGINTNKVLFFAYVNMGVMAAVAGIAVSSRLNASSPLAGQNFELDAIAACFIGGASATGGIGTIVGAIIGALVMGVLNNGMSIMGIGSDIQMVVKGLVLLAAVAFDVLSKRKAR